MKRIKIPLSDELYCTLPDNPDPPIPHFERDFRIRSNFPKYYIFVIDHESPSRNWLAITTANDYVVPGLYAYAQEHLFKNNSENWRCEIYNHNSITDDPDSLVHYLATNIDNHVGTRLQRALVHNEFGDYNIVQPLFEQPDDFIAEYKESYIPRLRHMERITNIVFTNKFGFDKEFRLKCRD